MTLLFLTAITSTIIASFFVRINDALSLNPTAIVFRKQVYRLISYIYVHGSILHYLGNSFAAFPLLSKFENQSGSLLTLAVPLIAFTLLPSLIYVSVSIAIDMNIVLIGASGMVFALLALEAMRQHAIMPSTPLLGFSLPTWSLPFIILVVIAVLIPGSSFLGHFLGMIIGYFFHFAWRYVTLPPRAMNAIERKLSPVTKYVPSYVPFQDLGQYAPLNVGDIESLPPPVVADTPRSENYEEVYGVGRRLGE